MTFSNIVNILQISFINLFLESKLIKKGVMKNFSLHLFYD